MLRLLARQKLAMHLDQSLAGLLRRLEPGEWIVVRCKRRLQARNIEPRSDQVAFDVVQFGCIDSWIQFDQHIPRLDRRPIVRANRAHHAGFGRLDHLGAAIHDDLAKCGRDHIHLSQRCPRHRRAKQQDDAHADGPADRRRRRLDHLDGERR